jgi:signal transduction histidine kinase
LFEQLRQLVSDASGWAYAIIFVLALFDAVVQLVASESSVITAGVERRSERADDRPRCGVFSGERGRTVHLEVERDQKVREAAGQERMRIARELHDIISHSVSVMVVQAGAAEEVLEHDQAQVRASLRSIQETGRQARQELRQLLGLIRTDEETPELAPQPSLAQLATLADQLRQSGLEVELDVLPGADVLPAGLAVAVYRIVQEGLTNALKHGGPGRSRVSVWRDGATLDVEVLNEGRGTSSADDAGFGLVGMSERVAVYGGELTYGRRDDGWYELRARLPVEAAAG